MRRIVFVCVMLSCATHFDVSSAATIFESGTLGPTGVSYSQLGNTVPGTEVNSSIFAGVRFEVMRPVRTSHIGGHFVAPANGAFFGVIVALDDENDFPNSADLSTPDVLGVTTIDFPNPSLEVFGSLGLRLGPGWYALVFGSGLYGTSGSGGAVRNGMDIGSPSYIGYGPNLQWFNFDVLALPFDNHRFVISGEIVPEPGSTALVNFAVFLIAPLSVPKRSAFDS